MIRLVAVFLFTATILILAQGGEGNPEPHPDAKCLICTKRLGCKPCPKRLSMVIPATHYGVH